MIHAQQLITSTRFIFSSGSVIAEPIMDIYGNTNEKNLNIVSVVPAPTP